MQILNQTNAASRAQALAQHGRVGDAYRTLEQAIAAGNAQAAMTLASWRLSGAIVRRDISAARALYGRAAELGSVEALPIHIALLASGAGGAPREWARAMSLLRQQARRDPLAGRQIALIEAMRLDAKGDPSALPLSEPLNAVPPIERISALLTPDECRYLAERALPLLQPSVVVHPQGGQLVQDPIRTARSAGFPFVLEDPVLHAINRRIAAVTGTNYEQGEPLQVLCYEPGEEYKLHSDALPPGNNQRAATLLVALNAEYDGGETAFPRLGLTWRGAVGEALHFRNVAEAGEPDALTWHCGCPVKRGCKLILSKWIRAAPLDLSGPPGRPF